MTHNHSNRFHLATAFIFLAGFFISIFAPAAAAEKRPAELWLYYATNLQVPGNVDALETIWKRAAAAGYDHILLTDSKFARLGTVPEAYFDHCHRAQAIAARLHLHIVPALFPIGYSNDLLFHDTNLAEGVPVRNTPFIVHRGEARIGAESAVDFNKLSFKDDNVELTGHLATFHPGGVHARFTYSLTLPRFRCYHVSVQVRTQDCAATPEIKALAGGHALSFSNLGVKPTQNWTLHHIVFDTLDNSKVMVYFGVWDKPAGTLQWKDWKIEEVGLLNVLRREGAPCIVTREDGTVLREGTDYQPIVDPHMGNVPWAGEYQVWHEPPSIKTSLPEGTRLRVSWYYPPVIYDGQVTACLSEPKLNDLLRDQARRMKSLWHSQGYMMSHDEIRVCNWDEACQRRGKSPGELLADNAHLCAGLIDPATVYAWSDMFDPNHNAVNGPYYLVNGSWKGSWEGLTKNVVIMNWNYGKRDASLKWFAARGHQQIIAGYYDADLAQMGNWLDSGRTIEGIRGCMYTTWRSDYSQLEAFAKLVRGRT